MPNEQEQQPGQAPEAPTATPTTDAPPATTGPTEQKVDDLPEWARKAIEKANGEAAGYRTKLREVETKLSSAKTPEEVEAATKELRETNEKLARELLVANVAKGDPEKGVPALPDELAALLKGSTEEELKAHAEVLRKYVPKAGKEPKAAPPEKLGGGLNGKDEVDTFDVKETARKARLGLL